MDEGGEKEREILLLLKKKKIYIYKKTRKHLDSTNHGLCIVLSTAAMSSYFECFETVGSEQRTGMKPTERARKADAQGQFRGHAAAARVGEP